MDDTVRHALENDRLIDITTTGRRSGEPRRIEIAFFYMDGRLYISGRPGRRGWYANLLANPELTIHFKQSVQKDVPAKATPITEPDQRRHVFQQIHERAAGRFSFEVDDWVAGSPLVEVQMDDA